MSNWYEIEELAAAVLGYSEEDGLDSGAIENKLADRFEVSMEQFQKIVEALIPFTNVAQSPLTKELYQGFSLEEWKGYWRWIVKEPYKPKDHLADGGKVIGEVA